MPMRIFFDTVAFSHIGNALEKKELPLELKEQILISPLTVFEILSQLTISNADEILRQIHTVPNWANIQHTGLLPWPDDGLFMIWHKKPPPDDGFTKKMETAFNTCLASESVEQLRGEAKKLKDAMDEAKRQTAENFRRLLDAARKESLDYNSFSNAWFRGIATRIKADPESKSMDEIISALNAYFEYEREKLQVALQNKNYNPLKHQNDLLDAEQLINLSDPSLFFLTCDTGFRNFVRKSPQAERIMITSQVELAEGAKVEGLLRKITQTEVASKTPK